MGARLSVVLIARDEEKNIAECIGRLSFCDEIVVVDSGSRDRTSSLARSAGAVVYENPFRDFASQKNFGISKAQGEWVLLVDADERVSVDLGAEIRKVLERPSAEGYFVKRLNRIFGRWMRWGAQSDDWQLRLVRREKAVFKGRVHERIFLDGGKGRLQNVLRHESTPTIRDYMRKLNTYTSLEVQNLSERGEAMDAGKMKNRPFLLFFYWHVVRGGFLDGFEGFLFNWLSAYYEFVRRAKQWELEVIPKPPS